MKNIKKYIYPFFIVIGFYVFNFILNSIFNAEGKSLIIDTTITLLLIIILVIIYRNKISNDFKNFIKGDYKQFFKYFKFYLISYAIMIFSNILIAFFVEGIAENEQIARELVVQKPIYSFILMCLFAPFYEEVLLRLNFKDMFKNKWAFAISTGVIFGLLHVISVTSFSQMLFIIPYSIMGISFGLIYFESNNIFFSVLIHFLNNLFSFILILLVFTA